MSPCWSIMGFYLRLLLNCAQTQQDLLIPQNTSPQEKKSDSFYGCDSPHCTAYGVGIKLGKIDVVKQA